MPVDPRISRGVPFTPDGKTVAYPIAKNGVDSVWIQPLDGSRPPVRYFSLSNRTRESPSC